MKEDRDRKGSRIPREGELNGSRGVRVGGELFSVLRAESLQSIMR